MYPGPKNPNWRGGKVCCVCQWCGGLYYVTPALVETTKYCCRSCLGKAASKAYWGNHVATSRIRKTKRWKPMEAPGAHTRLGIAKICGHLTAKGRSYCHKCSPRFSGLVTFTCPVCNKELLAFKSVADKRRACSRECYAQIVSERQKGPKSHLWKGGLTEQNMILRGSKQTSDWRSKVFARDKWKCVKCGKGGRVTADHILPWALFPEKRFDVSNGRTLCWPCHYRIGLNPAHMSDREKQKLIKDAEHGLPGI